MLSGTGTCTINANQSGNSNYNPAQQKQTSATAAKIDPTVTFTGAPANAPYQGPFTVASTTNASTLRWYTAGGVCSNASPLYTMTSGTGTCPPTVNWAPASNYNAPPRNQPPP